MKKREKTLYQAKEFARLTGVTVRALHHYDYLGLLKPSRSESGYRLYGEQELARLQQVITLKFIGLSLKEIKALLGQKKFDLQSTLLMQKEAIQSKQKKMAAIAKAIDRADRSLKATEELDWSLFKTIVEEIEMENKMEWMKNYYTEEQRAELSKRWHPDMQEQATKDWNSLMQEAEALANGDPAGPKAQALAEAFEKQIRAFTGGNPEIAQSLNKLYQDKDNWPKEAMQEWRSSLSQQAEEFINLAREIWQKKQR